MKVAVLFKQLCLTNQNLFVRLKVYTRGKLTKYEACTLAQVTDYIIFPVLVSKIALQQTSLKKDVSMTRECHIHRPIHGNVTG